MTNPKNAIRTALALSLVAVVATACSSTPPPTEETGTGETTTALTATCIEDGAQLALYCGTAIAECLVSLRTGGSLCGDGATFTQQCAEAWDSFRNHDCMGSSCATNQHVCIDVQNNRITCCQGAGGMLVQAFIGTNGQTAYRRTCPMDENGPSFSQCSDYKVLDISHVRSPAPAPAEAYAAQNNYTYNNGTTLRQVLLSLDHSSKYERDCPIAGTEIDFNHCHPAFNPGLINPRYEGTWTVTDAHNIRKKGPLYENYRSMVNYRFNDGNGYQFLRQSLVENDGQNGWVHTCPINGNGPDYDHCRGWNDGTEWMHINNAAVLGPGRNDSFASAANYPFTFHGAQRLWQSLVSMDGVMHYHRTCSFNLAGPDFTSKATGGSYDACTPWLGEQLTDSNPSTYGAAALPWAALPVATISQFAIQ